MGEIVFVRGLSVASVGVPPYLGLARLRVSWSDGFFRFDCFGHGFNIKIGIW